MNLDAILMFLRFLAVIDKNTRIHSDCQDTGPSYQFFEASGSSATQSQTEENMRAKELNPVADKYWSTR